MRMGEYPQDWLITEIENDGQRQAAWRTDPAQAGLSNCTGDIGSHIEHLVSYITGLKIDSLCAKLDIIRNRITSYNVCYTKLLREVFSFQMGNGNYNIFIGELVSGSSYAMAIQQDISVNISNSNTVFLYPNQQVNFNQNSSVVTKSAEICAGKASDLDKIGVV